jgi:GT2 family glycosyltransferase
MLKLSVVVATYHRCETLKDTLGCLAKQTLPAESYEVLVVDDGGTDGTRAMVEALAPSLPYRLRYFWHQNRGPGASQNRGIREAAADLILLMPDDVQPTPTMLAAHVEFHQRHPEENIAALGRVLQSPALPRTMFLTNWDPFKFKGMTQEMELPYWKFWACNISVHKSFLLKNGLFSEWLGAAHEDVELGYRLARKGLRIVYTPEPLAYHYHLETLESAVARQYQRGLNWRIIEEAVKDPQIHVFYKILTRHTLKYHVQTFARISQTDLPAGDRFLPWLLFKQTVRWVVFNRFTVPAIWLPFLAAADKSPVLAAVVHPYMVRGAVFYHFVKGYRDSFTLASPQSRRAEETTSEPAG